MRGFHIRDANTGNSPSIIMGRLSLALDYSIFYRLGTIKNYDKKGFRLARITKALENKYALIVLFDMVTGCYEDIFDSGGCFGVYCD